MDQGDETLGNRLTCWHLAIAVTLVLVTVAVFWPTVHNDFVNWDDRQNFQDNGVFQGSGWSRLSWMFTTFHMGVYQPLAWMILVAQHALGGMNPQVYHLGSLLLHALNCVVMYVLCFRLLEQATPPKNREETLRQSYCAGMATLLFAVHPLRTEVVSWVSCQPYLPATLFFMLSLLMYLGAFRKPGSQREYLVGLGACFSFFIMAVLSKAVALTLPVVLLVLDLYPLRRLHSGLSGKLQLAFCRRVLIEKLPFLLVAALIAWLAIDAKQYANTFVPMSQDQISSRFANFSYSVMFYLHKTIWPAYLSPYYILSSGIDILHWRFLLSIAAVILISVIAALLYRRLPGLLVAWISYIVILLPNSGLVRLGEQITADRYGYLSMLGWVVLLAGGMFWLLKRSKVVAGGVVCTILLVVLGLLTRDQIQLWSHSRALWEHVVRVAPDTTIAIAHANLGEAYISLGMYQEAESELKRSLDLRRDNKVAHYNLGYMYLMQGQIKEGRQQLEAALKVDPDYIRAHYNLGVLAMNRGDFKTALARMERILQINSRFLLAYVTLGDTYYNLRDYSKARQYYEQVLSMDKNNSHARQMLQVIRGQ